MQAEPGCYVGELPSIGQATLKPQAFCGESREADTPRVPGVSGLAGPGKPGYFEVVVVAAVVAGAEVVVVDSVVVTAGGADGHFPLASGLTSPFFVCALTELAATVILLYGWVLEPVGWHRVTFAPAELVALLVVVVSVVFLPLPAGGPASANAAEHPAMNRTATKALARIESHREGRPGGAAPPQGGDYARTTSVYL